ncbi:uncharacterized protein LOC110098103 isoform X1 [Dendrobium catenatum]|uniref:uncharacterized protein LOC110098103 isoform X1 n=2 Tax=Dendrobium catenatum TaxID=906689 RepID=UPI0009F66F9F|nr:uncharacterized protein LOC110098103 isoform X1 [Dendrobium catenatum]
MREGMMSVLLQHPQNLLLQGHESFLKTRLTKVQGLGSSGVEFPSRGTPTQTRLSFKLRGRNSRERLVSVHVVPDDAEGNSLDDESLDEEETSPNECKEVPGGLSREDLERIVGQDESAFSGVDLARLIRNKYGRSYDVQLIKKEFMGRNLLAMNVMWKYMEQRSFPLTEEEYILRLDDIANTLKCWGAVSHIRNSLAKLKERPRIGKAVSIFIDMDESGGRSNEWIYK